MIFLHFFVLFHVYSDLSLIHSWPYPHSVLLFTTNACLLLSPLWFTCCCIVFVFQIRVVNAFRMGLDRRYDSSSLSSVRSYHSLQNAKAHKQPAPTSPLASPDVAPLSNENTTSLWWVIGEKKKTNIFHQNPMHSVWDREIKNMEMFCVEIVL